MEDDRRGLRPRHPDPPARHLHVRPRGRDPHARAGRGRADHRRRLARRASSATSARPTTPPRRPASSPFARTWALELARAQITVNAIIPTAWTAMTATHPGLRAAGRARRARRAAAARRCAGSTRSACPRSARRSWCSSPPTPPPGSPGRRSALGGDRLALCVAPGGDRDAAARRRLERRGDRGGVGARRSRERADLRRRASPLDSRLDGRTHDASTSTRIVAIDVHTHAERIGARAAGPGHRRDPRRPRRQYFGGHAAAAHRAGGRRLLPRALDARGGLHRRRRGRHGPAAARQRRGARGRGAPTPTC